MTIARWVIIEEFTTPVDGVTEVNLNGVSRQQILQQCHTGVPARLMREPRNRVDPDAISVSITAGQIGYIPSDLAVEMAPLIDAGERRYAAVLSTIGSTMGDDGVEVFEAVLTITERIERPESRSSIFTFFSDLIGGVVSLLGTILKPMRPAARWAVKYVDRLLQNVANDDKVVLISLRVAAVALAVGLVVVLLRLIF